MSRMVEIYSVTQKSRDFMADWKLAKSQGIVWKSASLPMQIRLIFKLLCLLLKITSQDPLGTQFPHENVRNDEWIWERHLYKMAATGLNEMRRYFENNSRTKDFVAHTAKVCKDKLLACILHVVLFDLLCNVSKTPNTTIL